MRDLNAIGRIGIGDRGSVTRLVFSIKELRSRQLLLHLMRQAGLKIHIDGIGNIFGRLESSDRKEPAVLAGSHLDTRRWKSFVSSVKSRVALVCQRWAAASSPARWI